MGHPRRHAPLSPIRITPPPPSRDALEGKGLQRPPQKRLDRRLEEVAKAVWGGYCRLQMPLELAPAVRGTVAGHTLGALGGWGTPTSPPPPPPLPMRPPPHWVRRPNGHPQNSRLATEHAHHCRGAGGQGWVVSWVYEETGLSGAGIVVHGACGLALKVVEGGVRGQ